MKSTLLRVPIHPAQYLGQKVAISRCRIFASFRGVSPSPSSMAVSLLPPLSPCSRKFTACCRYPIYWLFNLFDWRPLVASPLSKLCLEESIPLILFALSQPIIRISRILIPVFMHSWCLTHDFACARPTRSTRCPSLAMANSSRLTLALATCRFTKSSHGRRR